MKHWDEIVNKALLGSEKVPLTAEDLPSEITDTFHVVASADNEETFLTLAALAFQYRQGGAKAMNASQVVHQTAPVETKPYCTPSATSTLKSLLDEDVYPLLKRWLGLCASKNLLAAPEVLPVLLDLANRKKELWDLVMQVSGERGVWLCSLNPQWNVSTRATDIATTWTDGSSEERKELLKSLRRADPQESIKLVSQSWATEGANEKIAFLDILKVNASDADLPWLESLKEKSVKVNNAILDVLKLIPSSSVVKEYQRILTECVQVRHGKALLGMISKTELVINESFAFPEAVFKTGIDKLSSDKNISDGRFIIAQLMMAVPPSFWTQHLQQTPAEIVALFQKNKQNTFYIPAIGIAAERFRDPEWIRTILNNTPGDLLASSLITLLSGLPEGERNQYALRCFELQPDQIIQLLLSSSGDWDIDLAKTVIRHTAKEVYQYNRLFYKQAIAYIPVSILSHIDSFTPVEEQKKPYWQTQRDELTRLLMIKQQTLQSFNA